MTHHPAHRRPPVIVCHDETSDFLAADLQGRFRTDPVGLADLHRTLADMRARFTTPDSPEGSR
ncbi:hypothetical protein [Streptomyces sp. NPDC005345]|uniref:hypothetical protein n=1 Tax=Streptomyces sp. NPDC005345 TaxID=3156877 RepID=UPI0033B1BF24